MLKTHTWVFPRNPHVTDQYFESISKIRKSSSKIRTSILKTIPPSYFSVLDEFNDTHKAILRKIEHHIRKFEHHFRKQYGHRTRLQIPCI